MSREASDNAIRRAIEVADTSKSKMLDIYKTIYLASSPDEQATINSSLRVLMRLPFMGAIMALEVYGEAAFAAVEARKPGHD